MTTTLHFHPWFTAPAPLSAVTTYAEADEVLTPELSVEDNIEWLEVGDSVRIERTVRRSDAPAEFGTIRRVNAQVQYALVELETSGFWEWFSVSELYLVLKAAANEVAKEKEVP